MTSRNALKHGMSRTRIYSIWHNMIQRCKNPKGKNKCYEGVKVCIQWHTFNGFYKEMGESYVLHLEKHGKKNTTIDRINSQGDYSKSNCKWSTIKEQNRNAKTNRMLTWNGMTKCVNEWAEYLGIKRSTLSQRLNAYKWSIEKCLTT